MQDTLVSHSYGLNVKHVFSNSILAENVSMPNKAISNKLI